MGAGREEVGWGGVGWGGLKGELEERRVGTREEGVGGGPNRVGEEAGFGWKRGGG